MTIAFTSYGPYDNIASGAAAAIESGDISYVAGQPIVIEAGASATLSIDDTADLSWNLLPSLPLYYATSGEYQYVWYAIPASSGTTRVTVTRASSGSYFSFAAKAYTADAGTPLLVATSSLGNYTSAATAFSQVVNPTTNGSAVWLALHTSGGGANPTPGSGCAIYSSFISAGNRTSVCIGATVEPLTSNSSVTLGGTITADFQYAQWIVYEVPYFVPGPPVFTTQPNNRAVNVGGDASFSAVAASQGGTGLTYAWEYNDGGGWTSAGSGGTYTISGAGSSVNGRQVRVTATDSLGSVTSDTATLTVITSWANLEGALGELAIGEFALDSSGGGTTTVNADFSGTHAILGAVGANLSGAYGISAFVGANFSGTHSLLSTVGSTLDGSYNILTTVGGNLSGSHAIANAVGANNTGTYALAGAVGSDFTGSHAVLSKVASDLAAAYAVLSEVGGDLNSTYSINSAVGANRTGAYAVNANVSADLSGSYLIATSGTPVGSNLDGGYSISAAVGSSFAGAYTIQSNAVQPQTPAFYAVDDDPYEVQRQQRARIIRQNNALIMAVAQLAAEGAFE